MADYLTMADADFKARCWIGGTTRDKDGKITYRSGAWHERHHHHPWVRESITEGWDRELRSVVLLPLTKLIFRQQHEFKAYPSIEDLMPGREWVDYARKHAIMADDAYAWQRANMKKNDKVVPGVASIGNVTRAAFRRMQEKSPNRRMLHVDHAALHRRITGDRE